MKDVGEVRKLHSRRKTIWDAILQVRQFRVQCMERNRPMVNLNSTYVLHARYERAEVLQPGFAAACDEKQLGSIEATIEAKSVISMKDTDEMKRRLDLGRRVRKKRDEDLKVCLFVLFVHCCEDVLVGWLIII